LSVKEIRVSYLIFGDEKKLIKEFPIFGYTSSNTKKGKKIPSTRYDYKKVNEKGEQAAVYLMQMYLNEGWVVAALKKV
jgi:hypothetical protein